MDTPQNYASVTLAPDVTLAASDASAARVRRFAPSFADVFFFALIVWLFLSGANGWNALLVDADAGWHIRTGEYILQHHSVPTVDLFSFTKPGAPWFAWEWLSDVLYALLYDSAGLKGVVLVAGVLIAAFATVLLRHVFWRGANAFVALPLVLVAVGSSTMHLLARPHVFTMLLLPCAMWMIEADRRQNSRLIWLLIPITAVWTNLHGGFAILLACLGLLAAGTAIEAYLGTRAFGQARRYAILFISCAAASVINPYGIGLHRHILEYLQSDWIRNAIQEFQAPTFRSEGQLQFEALLIAGVLVAAMLLQRGQITDALWILSLAHASLNSVRHAPIFAIVAVPLVAEEAARTWTTWICRQRRGSLAAIVHQIGADLAPSFRRSTVWAGLAVIILAAVPQGSRWPADFPKEFFPGELITRRAAMLEGGRVLTTDQWSDYLIFRFYPTQKVYVDGRSDFYGEALGKEYLHVLNLGYDWGEIMRRRAFTAVLLPPEWPIVEMLKRNPEWKIVEDTGKAILFVPRNQQLTASLAAQTQTSSRTKENPVER